MKPWKLWMPLAIFAFIGGLSLNALIQPKEDFVRSKIIGQKLPEFALKPALPGAPAITHTDFRDGKVRLLNLFASWCLPCKAEAPQLDQLAKSGVEIYGIAINDKPEDLSEFLTRFGNPYTRIGADGDVPIQILMGSTAVPETFIIGGDGTVIYQHIGDIRAEQVPEIMAKIKAEK
jgi:cytochrome c biogenesis protein CcmG, thiol:disulfide interchange protein DsbE